MKDNSLLKNGSLKSFSVNTQAPVCRTPLEWKKWYEDPAFDEAYATTKPLGARCDANGTKLSLWSPAASKVTLRLYPDGDASPACAELSMAYGEHGVWEYETSDNLSGTYYDFALQIGENEIISEDPYAVSCGVNGHRSMILDLRTTDPDGWAQDSAPRREDEQIIYELHVKEFSWDKAGGFPESVRGGYRAFTCAETTLNSDGVTPTGIRYLQELGVTHVQLMPMYDYGSVDEALHAKAPEQQFNWGYDPVNYNVPEGSYASDPYHGEVRVREVKEMVQALHKAGFRVIMDVVYNHTYSLDSSLQKTMPWYFYRMDKKGNPSNGSGCGNDTASERSMCERYILDSVLYLAKEYHLDGFRFDLMGLLTTQVMNRIQTSLDAIYGEGQKLIYGEPWAAGDSDVADGYTLAAKKNQSELHPAIGMFNDELRDAVKGSVFVKKDGGFVNGDADKLLKNKMPLLDVPARSISYVSAHDNQTLWDKLTETTADPGLRRRENKLAAAIYLTAPGRPFMLSGEEFLRTKGGLEDSYNAPITVNRIDWSLIRTNADVVEYYRGLIGLRKLMPCLCDKSTERWSNRMDLWTAKETMAYGVDNLYLIFHAGTESVEVPLPEGDWSVLVDGEDSHYWERPQDERRQASGAVTVEPVSGVILQRL